MMNIGAGEIAVIAILALLILGPQRLPEFARGIGKFIREFRRQTDDVRNTVEREFYKMDREVSMNLEAPRIVPMTDIAARDPHGHSSEAAAHPALPSETAPVSTVAVTAANTTPSEPVPAPSESADPAKKAGAV